MTIFKLINEEINGDSNEIFIKKPFHCFGNYGHKTAIQDDTQKTAATPILLNHILVDFFKIFFLNFFTVG